MTAAVPVPVSVPHCACAAPQGGASAEQPRGGDVWVERRQRADGAPWWRRGGAALGLRAPACGCRRGSARPHGSKGALWHPCGAHVASQGHHLSPNSILPVTSSISHNIPTALCGPPWGFHHLLWHLCGTPIASPASHGTTWYLRVTHSICRLPYGSSIAWPRHSVAPQCTSWHSLGPL